MSLTFTDEELENYFRLQQQAENYINLVIRRKRAEEFSKQPL